MDIKELEYQIIQWQRKIERYKCSINANNRKIEELENIRSRLINKADEMESGLENTLTSISNRLDGINDCEKFKANYYEGVKGIVYNANTNSAITETRQAITNIRNESYRLDNDNDVLYGKISYANQQINQLRAQIRMEMTSNAEQGNQG